MNRKIFVGLVLILTVLFLVSCNTYYRCPAYSEVKMEKVDADNV
jgi:hypothetical protein